MTNKLKEFCHKNKLSVKTVMSLTDLSQSLVYRLMNSSDKDLLNIKKITELKLKKIGFDFDKNY